MARLLDGGLLMAAPLECDGGDHLEAKFIVGNAETGEQTFLCPAHMASFGLAMAINLMDPAEIIAEVQAHQPAPASDGPEDPAPRRGRKSKLQPVAKPAPDGPAIPGVAETPAPVADERDRGL